MDKKMEIALMVALFLAGGGIGFGISQATNKQEPIVVQDQVAKEQQEIIKQLTNLDLVIPMCSPTKEKDQEMMYDSVNQSLMCRYLSCLQFSRGIDSKTGGNGECEQISNIMNKKAIIGLCKKEETPELQKACIELFDRRL